MDLSNKLFGIPKVYYFNYDEHKNRNYHMDRNLGNLKVANYERITTSKYTSKNYEQWKDLIIDVDNYKLTPNIAGYAITVLEFLKKWLEETEENELIITKDTIDFDLIEHWKFDWNYLKSRLPYDWDCIQLGFENSQYIPFYLHPILPSSTFGPSLLNRYYVKKIVKLHCIGEQYKLNNYIANMYFSGQSGTVDYFIGHNGNTYSMPLFPNKPEFFDKNTKKYVLVYICKNAYHEWWKKESSKFNLDELFTYGKYNDIGMVKKLRKK